LTQESARRPVMPREGKAYHGDSTRGLDNAGLRPRCMLCSHGYRAVRKWRRVPGASPTRKILRIFSKINRPT